MKPPFFDMASRKRKSSSIDVPSAASEYHLPCKSSMKEFCSFSGANGQGKHHGVCSNQTKFLRPETLRHQFQGNQLQQPKDFEESRLTSGTPTMMPQSLDFKEPSPLLKVPAGGIHELNFTPQVQEMGGQTELQKSLSNQKLHSKNAELLLRVVPENQLMSWDKDHIFPDTVPMGMCNVSTEFVRPEGISSQSSLPDGSCDDFWSRACSRGAKKSENSFQLRQGGQFPNNSGTVKFPFDQIDSLGASSYAGQMGKEISSQSKVQSISSSPTKPLVVSSESGGAHGVCDFKLNESKEAAKLLETSVTASKQSNNVGNGVENGHSEILNQDFDKLSGKSISPGKTSIAAEKLWEGSLQLNSSVTVSAVAFFKSGEKLHDINWCEFVEVKGKVRLEAFEKYIQDLPRSRTRGLMVISLFWKEGSSESGLKGMKQVAKGYQKGERVGLARLSPGVDVYLCPRSNKIITILAKHGFFKGKAAVEDNSELFIGCVVWRKNQTTASSTAKRSESKGKSLQEQSLKSLSNTSSNQQAGGKGSSSVPPIQNSKTLAPVESSAIVENVNVTESKNISTGNPMSSQTLLPTPVSKVSSVPVGQQKSSYSTLPFEDSKGHLLEVEAASARSSEAEYPKESLELPKSIISLPSNVMKERIHRTDVDDLPEFDFGNTDETSLTPVSKPLDASAFNKKLQHEGNKNNDVMKLPMMPAIHSISASNSGSRNSRVHQLSSTFNLEIPVCKSIAGHEKRILVQQKSERNHGHQTSSPDPVAVGACTFPPTKFAFDKFGKKNLFDDDDDMPEWIPPERAKPSSAEAKEPYLDIPLVSSNPSSQSLPMGSSGQPHPSPYPAASLPECSSLAFQPSYRPPPNVKILPPIPPQHDSSSLTGFTFTPLLRPPSSSPAIRHPLLPADKRGSRP